MRRYALYRVPVLVYVCDYHSFFPFLFYASFCLFVQCIFKLKIYDIIHVQLSNNEYNK